MQAGLALGNLASVVGIRQEEAAVIAELRAGSEAAFSWLVAQYHQPIYSLIARTIQNPSEAADLTQEVFVKVYRGIGSFHGDSSLRTWIYRIALHEASNQRRWWGRHKRQEITIETECGQGDDGTGMFIKDMLVDGHESPYEQCAQQQLRARVEEEIRKVPEPFRTVVILRDIEGFGYEEIAEILATNLGTIKSRLMRGRAQLKTQLAPYVQAAAKRPNATVPIHLICFRGNEAHCDAGSGKIKRSQQEDGNTMKTATHVSSVCRHTREHFSAYLDGLVSGKVMQQIAGHLQLCNGCTEEFAAWRATQNLLSDLGPSKAPEDLALRLRVALSQAAAQTPRAAVDRWKIQWADVYQPFALRATAGLASALCLIGTVAMLVGMFAAPQQVEARDEPYYFASGPHFLYTSAEPDAPIGDLDRPLIIEAFVNDAGRVYDYRVVSGEITPAVRTELENTLLFSLFEPARSFGEPVRGTVVMSFSGVAVKG